MSPARRTSRGLLLPLLLSVCAVGAATGSAACATKLDAMSHCKVRIAATTACSLPALLSNTTVRAILQCHSSLTDCQSKCLDAAGLLGLPTNSTAAACTASDQLMTQKSGNPDMLIEFVPDPVTGLPVTRTTPSAIKEAAGSFPSFAFLGDYAGCVLDSDSQYCLVDGKVNLGTIGLGAVMGLCRPVECSEDEIHSSVESTLGQLGMHEYRVSCHTMSSPAPTITVSPMKIVALVLFMAIIALVALGTTWELQKKWHRSALAAESVDTAPLCARDEPQTPVPSFVSAFSLVRNVASFSKVRPQDPKEPAMACLDGLRVLSTLWVILGHVVIWPLISVSYEKSGMILPPKGRLTELGFQIVPGGYFAVDTFFWLSGFLGVYSLQAKVRRSPRLMSPAGFAKLYPMALLTRWLRLSIVYAFILLFTQTWYRSLGGSAPLWEAASGLGGLGSQCISSIDSDKCKSLWWTNLLYISTVVGDKNAACMAWTWYLSCDMQMFLTLPFFVLFRARGGKVFGWVVLAAATVASISANAWMIWKHDLVTDPVLGTVGGGTFMGEVYQVAWMRAQPYLIGIGCAWILESLHSPDARVVVPATTTAAATADQEAPAPSGGVAQLSQLTQQGRADALLPKEQAPETRSASPATSDRSGEQRAQGRSNAKWVTLAVVLQLLSFAAMIFVVFIPVTRYRCASFQDCTKVDTAPWSRMGNMLYGAFNHFIWGMGLGCLLLLCALRAPGTWWVNTLLGADFWQGPAKLTYVAYLIHPLVLVFFFCQRMGPVRYLDSVLVQDFVAYSVIVFLVSLLLWATVEKPAANLTAQWMGALSGARRGGAADH